jgi:hypothetical protein
MNTFSNNVDGFRMVAHYAVDDRVRQTAQRAQGRRARTSAEGVREQSGSRRFHLTWRTYRSAPAH